MGALSSLTRPMSTLKKQISVESRIERTVQGNGEQRHQRSKLGSSVSVTAGNSLNGVQRFPKPSKSAADPMNWPKWKTELAFISLMSLASNTSSLRLVLASTNAILSNEFGVSYLAVVSLTGVPIVLGAIVALFAGVLSRIVGRRLVLVVGTAMMLAGVLWNMQIGSKYSHFMVARLFQGAGWGMVDSVISNTISDLFSYDQRSARMNVFSLVTAFATWSVPTLSGTLADKSNWRIIFLVIGVLQALSFLMVVFFTPETRFDRPEELTEETLPHRYRSDDGGNSGASTSTVITSSSILVQSSGKTYLNSLRFPKPVHPWSKILPAKALFAPSTIVSFLLVGPLTAATFGLASSIALIFSIAPTLLKPQRIGYLFALPALFAITCHVVQAALCRLSSMQSSNRPKSRTISILVIAQFLFIGVGGFVGLGLYTCAKLGPRMVMSSQVVSVIDGEMLNESRLWVIGGLLGAAVVGAVGAKLFTSVRSLSMDPSVLEKSEIIAIEETEMSRLVNSATDVLINMMAGIFILAFPSWVASGSHSVPSQTSTLPQVPSSTAGPWKRHGEISTAVSSEDPKEVGMTMLMGIQMTSVALGITILVVGVVAAIAFVFGGEGLKKRDRRLLGFDHRDSQKRNAGEDLEMDER